MDDERIMLLQSLSRVISDYRVGEVAPMAPSHIERWLSQFEVSDQPVILYEMNCIMKNFYISRQSAKNSLHRFVKMLIGSEKPEVVLSHMHFLRTNQGGGSQEAMLNLVDEILLENYGFTIASIVKYNVQNYIYIDDAIYTGNKMRYAIEENLRFLKNKDESDNKLIIFVMAAHTSGCKYALQCIKNAYNRLNIKLFAASTIEDARFPKTNNIEILWPELAIGNSLIDSYISDMCTFNGRKLGCEEIFRSSGGILQEKLFSSSQARQIVERAFLVKGIELIKDNQYQAPSIRPLGFMKLTSLGFGTLFVTYRNIANNCPLVLWWGDTRFPTTHPLGKWYPLFPRKTNGNAIM